jgi:glycerophosphoryl diester phosphodiesterase
MNPIKQDSTVIAHRGASAYAPENTLAAFRLAKDMGADYFELDCTLSSDGEVIVIHDDTLDRTTDLKGAVADTPSDEIRRADAGSWFAPEFKGEPVPTLDEALDFAKDRIGVFVEVKDADPDNHELLECLKRVCADNPDRISNYKEECLETFQASDTPNLRLARAVIDRVRARDMYRQVVVQSFSPVVCAVVRLEAPEICVALLSDQCPIDSQQWNDYFFWTTALSVQGFNCHRAMVSPDLVSKCTKLNITVGAWTVNDERELKQFAQWGVRHLITDVPDVARAALGPLPPGRRS